MGSLSSMHKCLIALVVLSFIQAGGLPKAAEVQPLRGTPPGRPPGWRLRIVRWVETQRQLWSEQRLNSNQLRYMALLGLFSSLQSRCNPVCRIKEAPACEHLYICGLHITCPMQASWRCVNVLILQTGFPGSSAAACPSRPVQEGPMLHQS